MGRKFRSHGVRNGRHYGRYCARPARLGILPEVSTSGARGGAAAQRQATRCEKDEEGVRRKHERQTREFGTVQRSFSGRSDSKNGGIRGGEGIRQSRDDLRAEGLGDFAATVLGYADPGGVLRERRNGGGARQRFAGAVAAEPKADGNGRVAAGIYAGVRECDLPEVWRASATRDGHDGHVRGFIVVFLPLLRPAQ